MNRTEICAHIFNTSNSMISQASFKSREIEIPEGRWRSEDPWSAMPSNAWDQIPRNSSDILRDTLSARRRGCEEPHLVVEAVFGDPTW